MFNIFFLNPENYWLYIARSGFTLFWYEACLEQHSQRFCVWFTEVSRPNILPLNIIYNHSENKYQIQLNKYHVQNCMCNDKIISELKQGQIFNNRTENSLLLLNYVGFSYVKILITLNWHCSWQNFTALDTFTGQSHWNVTHANTWRAVWFSHVFFERWSLCVKSAPFAVRGIHCGPFGFSICINKK